VSFPETADLLSATEPSVEIDSMMFRTAKPSRGFTLIELLVALAILAVLALLAVNAFDGSRSKAQALIGLMKQVGDANIVLKNDTGCFVNRPDALFNETEALKTASNYCGRNFAKTWAQPYLAPQPTTAAGAISVEKIGADVTVAFNLRDAGSWKYYYTEAVNVPADVLVQALLECNADDAKQDVDAFPSVRCAGDPDAGTFQMMYAQTR
jgi:prepilin-type N-terminal cleavage/methylation domain-containing protein